MVIYTVVRVVRLMSLVADESTKRLDQMLLFSLGYSGNPRSESKLIGPRLDQ